MEETNINVLYIDDEPNNINSFKASFRRTFKVFTADSAEEGRKILASEEVHVILSDQRMPKETGIEFFQSILQSSYILTLHPSFPISHMCDLQIHSLFFLSVRTKSFSQI